MSENTGKGIKTREVKHDIKALDKSAEIAKSLKQAAIRTKDQVQNLMDDGQVTPEEYAEDKLRYAAEDTASEAGHQTKKAAQKTKEKVEDRIHQRQEKKQEEKLKEKIEEIKNDRGENAKEPEGKKASERHSPRKAKAGERPDTGKRSTVRQREYGVKQHEAKVRGVRNKKHAIRTTDASKRTIKQTAKSSGKATAKTAKGTVKTAQKAVKTAEQTSKAAIKTTKVAAKTAQKTAQATAKAAKVTAALVKKAAVAAYKAAVVLAKAIAAAVKAIIAAVKALVAAIAAGGWVAVVVILVVCLVALIVGSVFGIFFSSEDTGSEKSMQTVVREINTDYQNQLAEIKAAYTYDDVEMSGSTAVWREVLSIYAVRTNTDPDNPQEVASLDRDKESYLIDVFWEMNEIHSRTETETVTVIVESDDGHGNIVEEEQEETRTTLYITVSHKTADEMADEYDFTEEQKQLLADLLDEKNQSLWAAVLYGIHSGDGEIVAVALSQIGNVGGQPYWSWYGFGSRVEWCACFVSWCANECGYIEDGIIPKYAGCVNGVQWFRDRDQWIDGNKEPVPGMIIFFDWDDPDGSAGPQDGESDHTGIVERVEDGVVYTVEGNSGDSCRENHYPVGYYEILGYGVPAY